MGTWNPIEAHAQKAQSVTAQDTMQVLWRGVMHETPTRTRDINRVSGVYRSACHHTERTVLEGQRSPRCDRCNADTVWTFVRSTKSSQPKALKLGSHEITALVGCGGMAEVCRARIRSPNVSRHQDPIRCVHPRSGTVPAASTVALSGNHARRHTQGTARNPREG